MYKVIILFVFYIMSFCFLKNGSLVFLFNSQFLLQIFTHFVLCSGMKYLPYKLKKEHCTFALCLVENYFTFVIFVELISVNFIL